VNYFFNFLVKKKAAGLAMYYGMFFLVGFICSLVNNGTWYSAGLHAIYNLNLG